MSGIFSSATGGGGDDALIGGDAANILSGGPGNDTLSGGKGDDQLRGGPGDDALSPGEGATELADGGEGSRDVLSAADVAGPVSYSLDGVSNDGAAGQTVAISGIEDLTGSPAGDTLTGDAGFNHLYGLDGNDVIDGAGGGHDVLRGGQGDDQLRARDASALFSDVACGGGADTAIVDAADLVDADCESVDRAPAPAGFVAPSFPGGPTATTVPATGGTGATTGGGATSTGAAAPAAALTLEVPKGIARAALRAKGLTLKVSASVAADVTVELLTTARAIRASVPADNVVLARSTKRGVTTARTFTLRPDASLLRGARTLAVRVTAMTGPSVRSVERRSVTLR